MSDETWATRTVIGEAGELRRAVRRVAFEMTTPRHTRRVELSQRTIRAGSRPENDLVIHDETVSRLHFEVVAEERGFRIRDLGSRNGTSVDGLLIHDAYLRPGSAIEVGRSRLIFQPTQASDDLALWSGGSFGGMIGVSPVMRELFAVLDRASKSNVTVLVEGESGTGKELVANALHASGARRTGPMVVADCGSMPATLLESILFGHERGAFTGADTKRTGLFEEADGGTLFLDELGELPLELQPKLLRVLETGEVRPLGSSQPRKVDVRIIAATNRDLAQEVNRGAFREDLYYRVAVVRVQVPPLRERRDDVRPLVEHQVRSALEANPARAAQVLASIRADDWKRLEAHPWPGNVRELRNVVRRSIALGQPEMSPNPVTPTPTRGGAAPGAGEIDLDRPYGEQKAELLAQFDRRYFLGQLSRHDGNISRAARAAGMERMHFKRMVKKLDT